MTDLLFGRSGWIRLAFGVSCSIVGLYLVLPLIVIVPLSFNAEPYFSFPITQYSLRWYDALLSNEWGVPARNSLIVASLTTALSTVLGSLAAIGLARPDCPFRRVVLAAVALPILVPMIVTGAGLYFTYAKVGLTGSIAGLVLAHTSIATPFVVISVTNALKRFDPILVRAASSLGSSPVRTYTRVVAPLILPGIVSGMVFAFVTSLDDVVLSLFIADAPQRTIARQMWSGVRENIDPTILAAAVCLTVATVGSQLAGALLERRTTRDRR